MFSDIEAPVTKRIKIQTELLPARNAAKSMSTLSRKFD